MKLLDCTRETLSGDSFRERLVQPLSEGEKPILVYNHCRSGPMTPRSSYHFSLNWGNLQSNFVGEEIMKGSGGFDDYW